jgi:hypothetical protein
MANVDELLTAFDEDQVKMMEERVILVDENDNVLGHASKKECTCRETQPHVTTRFAATPCC